MKQIYKKENRILLSNDNRNDSHQSAVLEYNGGDHRKMFWHGGAVFIRSSVFQNGISMVAMSKNFHQNRGPKISFWLAQALDW